MAQSEGGEKTEQPTSKKKQDARKKGNVAQSQEIPIAASILVMFFLLLNLWQGFLGKIGELLTKYLSAEFINKAVNSLSKPVVTAAYYEVFKDYFFIIIPVFLAAMLTGIIANILQTRPLFTSEPLKPKFSRINPISGLKKMFSITAVMNLLKSLAKAGVMGYIAYLDLKDLMVMLPAIMRMSAFKALTYIFETAFGICLKMGIAMAIIAILDLFYSRWKYNKDLMMTKQEVKDEFKQTEGDPKVKSKIKQKQQQMSAMRMMQRVPDADVVITNPTHYAVALRYKEGVDRAPVVLAKGQDFMARKIKDLAKECRIEIVENKAVARALYESCEIGQEIPKDMYQAIADILVYVYKQRNRTPRRAAQ